MGARLLPDVAATIYLGCFSLIAKIQRSDFLCLGKKLINIFKILKQKKTY